MKLIQGSLCGKLPTRNVRRNNQPKGTRQKAEATNGVAEELRHAKGLGRKPILHQSWRACYAEFFLHFSNLLREGFADSQSNFQRFLLSRRVEVPDVLCTKLVPEHVRKSVNQDSRCGSRTNSVLCKT